MDFETAHEIKEQIEEKILEQYPPKQARDGCWYVNIRFSPGSNGRKTIRKGSRETLEKAIIDYVGNRIDGRKMDDNANIRDFDGVYLITDGEYVKIGVANNIIDRIRKLQTGNAKKLIVLAYQKCPNAYSIEKALHKKYKHQKVSGEWYDILNQVDAGLTIQNLLL